MTTKKIIKSQFRATLFWDLKPPLKKFLDTPLVWEPLPPKKFNTRQALSQRGDWGDNNFDLLTKKFLQYSRILKKYPINYPLNFSHTIILKIPFRKIPDYADDTKIDFGNKKLATYSKILDIPLLNRSFFSNFKVTKKLMIYKFLITPSFLRKIRKIKKLFPLSMRSSLVSTKI